MSELTYESKKNIADEYLEKVARLTWDELSDINSLHDAEDEADIRDLCNDRLEEDGFPFGEEEPAENNGED